jgi:hypothetical protein
VAAKLDALAVVATGDDQQIEAERQRQQQLVAESGKQLAMLAERERQLPRTVRRDDDDEDDDDDVGHGRASLLAAAQWKSLVASRTTTRAGHAAATASLQVLSQFSDEAKGIGGDSGCGGGGGGGGGPGPLTRPPQHQQRRDQMLKRMEALRQEALSAQAYLHDTHQRLEVALEVVAQQQQQQHELGASPTSLLPRVGLLRPSTKHNRVSPVVVRDANARAKLRWRAHLDLDGCSSASSSSAINSSSSASAINSAINSDVNSDASDVGSSNLPHTDQEDAARMADVSASRDQALELHNSEANTLRNGDLDSTSSEIGDDGGADMTAVTSTLGHSLGRRAPRRVVRRIVPKSAATTGQQQRPSVLNDRRQVTSSPSAPCSDNPAAPAAEALEAARQRQKAADAKARAAKARKALSPEYMRKAAAAMFENAASVAQHNDTEVLSGGRSQAR